MKAVLATLVGLALLPPAALADGLKLGASLSITGPASFLGDPEAKTLELYVEAAQRRRAASWASRSS